jgi:hypothetical protein
MKYLRIILARVFFDPPHPSAPLMYRLINASACRAQFLFFMVLKMHLAKVIVAVVAMPTGYSVTDYTLPDRFVVVVVFSLFCSRWFLLLWLCLHMPYASEGQRNITEAHLVQSSKIITVVNAVTQRFQLTILLFKH